MTNLVEFLLARISEDEADARDTEPLPEWAVFDHDVSGWREAPRVLAECDAKRRVITEHSLLTNPLEAKDYCRMCVSPYGFAAEHPTPGTGQTFPCLTLRALALPYADHPDYREEWKP